MSQTKQPGIVKQPNKAEAKQPVQIQQAPEVLSMWSQPQVVIQRALDNPQSLTVVNAARLQRAVGNQALRQLAHPTKLCVTKLDKSHTDMIRASVFHSEMDNSLIRREDDLSLPSVPNFRLTPPSLGQPFNSTGRYRLGGNHQLQLGPAIKAIMLQHLRRQLNPDLITKAITQMNFPAPIRTILGGPIRQAATNLLPQTLEQLEGFWDRLSTANKIGAASIVTSSGLAVLGSLDPESRQSLFNIINNKVLPVPGLNWLHGEFSITGNSIRVGLHLNIGHLLWPSVFGKGSPLPMGVPPKPETFENRPVQRMMNYTINRTAQIHPYTTSYGIVSSWRKNSTSGIEEYKRLTYEPTREVQQTSKLQLKRACGVTPVIDDECTECRKNRLGVQRRPILPTKLATTTSIRHEMLRLSQMLQRLGDTSKVSPGFPCTIASNSPASVTDIMRFGNRETSLSTLQIEQIDNFVRNWRAAGGSTEVRVDGFASLPGPDELNWKVSCERAQIVARELRNPSSGRVLGIPTGLISVLAQGETGEFGSDFHNRVVTLSTPKLPTHSKTSSSQANDFSRERQVVCVRRLGGCPNTRSGGLPSAEEIDNYNRQCRTETQYSGPIVTPSSQECANPPHPPEAPDTSPIEVKAIDEIDSTGTLESVFSIGEVNFTNINSMVNNVLTRIRQRPMGRLNIQVHGDPQTAYIGHTPITTKNFGSYRAILQRLNGHFTSGGFVHLRACLVGQNQSLLKLFADAFGVPVYAGTGLQRNIIVPFNEGEYVRCDPGGRCQTKVSRP